MKSGHGNVEVRVFAVDMINEHSAGDFHVGCGLPQLGGHDLRTLDCVYHEERRLGGIHGGDGVADEIGMARRIKKVDLVIAVRDGGNGGADGELAPDLFLVIIEVRFPVMSRSHSRSATRDVQHRLSKRCLAGAVLADKDHVSHMFGSRSCHDDHQPSDSRPKNMLMRDEMDAEVASTDPLVW